MAKVTAEERFWAKVDRNGPVPDYRPDLGPCWIWTGATQFGYGRFSYGGFDGTRGYVAHRFSYEALVGPIPEGLVLDHLCRVRNCVNPAHLEPVTHRENSLRGVGIPAQNAQKTRCVNGHTLAPENLTVRAHKRECHICALRRKAAYRARVRQRREQAR